MSALYPRFLSLEALQAAAVNQEEKTLVGSKRTVDASSVAKEAPQIPTTAPDGRPLTKLEIKRAKRAARRPNQSTAAAEVDSVAPALPSFGGISALWSEAGKNEEKKESTIPTSKSSGAGNLEEAKRIREALGYSSAATVEAEKEAIVEKPKKKQKKQNQKKTDEKDNASAPAEESKQASEAPPSVVAPTDKVTKGPFRFGFQLVQAQVEAQTEAKIAHILMMDSTKDGSGLVPRRVYICGMPHEYSEETVREYWAFCGDIEVMDLMYFPDTGNFNGSMFITFKTNEGYEAALSCNGEECEGRSLKVEKCKVPPLRKKMKLDSKALGLLPEGPPQHVEGYDVAYAGNLSYEVSREDLIRLFKPYKSKQVRLHTDKDTGKPKGFAHIHFPDAESVKKAVEELNGHELKGRGIKLSFAQPKSE